MHKIFLITLLLIVASCSSRSQPEDNSHQLTSINIMDREGLSQTFSNKDRLDQFKNVDFLQPQPYQKVLRIYGKDALGNIPAYVTSYHPNGETKQYLEIVNNRALGTYKEWYSDGTLKLETQVIGGTADLNSAAEKSWLFEGCSQVWDEGGNLLANIQYNKGDLEGLSTYFHANGNIWKKTPFAKNQLEGTAEIFLENGNLLQTSQYTQNMRDGMTYRYWKDNVISTEETYSKGNLIKGRYFDINGQLISQIDSGVGVRALFGKDYVCELQEFHDGIQSGKIILLDASGREQNVYFTKNGQKHGKEIHYQYNALNPTKSIPLLSINWYEGKIQGLVSTWYNNGNMESQKEMSENTKSGLSTAWYYDGNLMMIEEYDHDKLIKGEYYKKGEKRPVSLVTHAEGTVTLFDQEGTYIRKINYHNGKPQE